MAAAEQINAALAAAETDPISAQFVVFAGRAPCEGDVYRDKNEPTVVVAPDGSAAGVATVWEYEGGRWEPHAVVTIWTPQ